MLLPVFIFVSVIFSHVDSTYFNAIYFLFVVIFIANQLCYMNFPVDNKVLSYLMLSYYRTKCFVFGLDKDVYRCICTYVFGLEEPKSK